MACSYVQAPHFGCGRVLSKHLHLAEWSPPSSLHPVRDNPGKRPFFAKNNPNWRPEVRPNSIRYHCFDNAAHSFARLVRTALTCTASAPHRRTRSTTVRSMSAWTSSYRHRAQGVQVQVERTIAAHRGMRMATVANAAASSG